MSKLGGWVAAIAVAVIAGALAPAGAQAQGQAKCPWMDRSKTPEQRAGELIAAMDLDQKLKMVTYSDPPWMAYFGTAGHIDGQPELCIPTLVLSDAGSGVAGLQQGTTQFPSGVAQAATWNPTLQQRFGQAMAEEAWNKGINVMLAPGLNIARIATNGRNFEYMGEDPFLAGKMASAAVRGIQSKPVLAQPKHYAANNQESNRMAVSAEVDERTLREIYLPGFEMTIKEGGAASVMCAYNRVNGKYACENPELLDGYLRRDWGFDGFVTSDWGATHSTVESAMAGLDMEMHAAGPKFYGQPLREAIEAGKVPMARLDGMLRHIFVPMFRFGLFDSPPPSMPEAYPKQAITPEHRALARRIAQEATVLLKNDGILPLGDGRGRTIGVLGYAANPVGASNTSGGGGSSKGTGIPPQVSPLEGIQTLAAAHGDRVLYADGSSQADATAVARASDVVLVFAADSAFEGRDRADLGMRPGVCPFPICVEVPFDQRAMLDAAIAANPNTVVVLAAGGPVEMPWLGKVRAVVDQWYAGIENGNAIASVLYGEVNPSGKLPQTFPKSLADMPTRTPQQYPGVDGRAVYSEGLKVGYRWFDAERIEPLFPFGFGLSYTTFAYSGLRVERRGDGATVRFRIRNTGRRTGAETGQVYVGFPRSTGEPPRQLKGFRKVELAPGESRAVTVELDRRAFAHWSTRKRDWVQARGCYTISVGGSSRDLPLRGRVAIGARRSVLVRVRGLRGERIRRLSVTVNGRRVKARRRGARAVRISLGRPRQTAKVRIVAVTATGRRVVDRRTYRNCARR